MTTNEIVRKLKDAGFIETPMDHHRKLEKNGVRVTLPLTNSSNSGAPPWCVAALKSALRRAEEADPARKLSQDLPGTRQLTVGEAKPGRKVKSRREFVDVPNGTMGEIEEDYGSGFLVRWANGIRDGFDKTTELRWLEAVA